MQPLIDISALSACFKEYGPHPLHYVFRLLQPVIPSAYNLLGNAVNNMFDAVVSSTQPSAKDSSLLTPNSSLLTILQSSWHDDALLYLDVDDEQLRKVYFNNVQQQYSNVQQVVGKEFPRQHIDASSAWLEPSFVCPELGLSGRMDLLSLRNDESGVKSAKIVELKSGKMNEWQGHAKLAHRVQTMLYAEVLHRCMNIPHGQIHSYLHYNTYPLLEHQLFPEELCQQALDLRDEIQNILHQIAAGQGRHFFTRKAVEQMYPDEYNNLWQKYDKPQLIQLVSVIEDASEEMQEWFFSRLAFILREEELKAEQPEAVSLRSLPLKSLETNEDEEVIDLILSLTTPHSSLLTPNCQEHDFRPGDPVLLYPMSDEETQRHDGIILRGSIATISDTEITVCLRHPERPCHFEACAYNSSLLTPNFSLTYALEHDTINSNVAQACRSIYSVLLTPNFSLLTNTRLIVGPPGTGKTSVTLRKMVQKLYQDTTQRVLLLAFTHRAVDEICETLDAVCPYVRLGSMTDTPEAFRPHLLQNIIDQCSNRNDLRQRLEAERFYVGTTARLLAMPHIFDLLGFDTIIVDEASQLLDHQVIGLLKHARQECVLIGDPKQLPAVTLQTGAQSLFEQLYRQSDNSSLLTHSSSLLLTHQGRMHPAIAQFANKLFYGGQLSPVGLPHQQEQEAIMPRYSFIDVPCQPLGTKSNPAEARMVARLVMRVADIYAKHGLDWTDKTLGIIVPYRQQIAAIKKELASQCEANPELSVINYQLSINIDTVERYQGSQRDVIIYSTTVSTPDQLELLSTPIELDNQLIDRKLNVAITRARKHLYIIGNRQLLSQSPIYQQLIAMMQA